MKRVHDIERQAPRMPARRPCDRAGAGRGRSSAALAFATAGVFAALLSLARGAAAQTTDSSSTTGRGIELGPDGTIRRTVPYRETGNKPYWISYSDCVLNDAFSFPVRVTDTSMNLEVWVGSNDCVAARSATTERGQCWIVQRVLPSEDTFRVEVPVRNVVARQTGTDNPPVDLGPEVCDLSQEQSGEQLTYYFMQVRSGQPEASLRWNSNARDGTGFDMVGPRAPGGISVGVGESQLEINLSSVSEDADRERFRAFCVPAGTALDELDAGAEPEPPVATDAGSPAPTAPGDAGAGGAGGQSAGEPVPAECANGVLTRSGVRAPVSTQYQCGEASEFSRAIRTSRLANDVTYAVAVAGEDSIGNTGALSVIRCGTPTELVDFFEDYIEAGGPGGGGFCGLGRGATRAGGASALALAGLAVSVLLRRRSRR